MRMEEVSQTTDWHCTKVKCKPIVEWQADNFTATKEGTEENTNPAEQTNADQATELLDNNTGMPAAQVGTPIPEKGLKKFNKLL